MASPAPAAASLRALLFRSSRLWDPEPRGVQDLLVVGERIAAVGPDLSGVRLEGLETVDLAGRCLVPGLVDPHVHLSGGGGEAGFGSRIEAAQASELLAAGITCVVGVLGTDGVTRSLADLYARAKALDLAGLSAWIFSGNYHLPVRTLTGSVQSDLVLIDKVVGVGELAIADHRSSQPSLAELARVAADCRVGGMLAGKPAPLHLHLGDRPAGLELLGRLLDETGLPPQQFWPTHVNRNRELLPLAVELLKRGMPFDLTAGFIDGAAGPGAVAELSVPSALRHFRSAGVDFGLLSLSSDAHGSMPVYDAKGRLLSYRAAPASLLIDELRACLAQGFALEEVLPLAGANPARILGLPGVGRLAPGCRADFLVCDEALGLHQVWSAGERRA